VRRVYPKVWESIFPDPPIPSLSPSAILVKERARRWRKIWMWVSAACWLYTPFVVGLFHQFSRRWWLLDFAIPALLVCAVTFYLAFRFPTACISSWRLALCGALCIWLPLFLSVLLWSIANLLNTYHIASPGWVPVPNPFIDFTRSCFACLAASILNWFGARGATRPLSLLT
jgi:hypothetical protein